MVEDQVGSQVSEKQSSDAVTPSDPPKVEGNATKVDDESKADSDGNVSPTTQKINKNDDEQKEGSPSVAKSEAHDNEPELNSPSTKADAQQMDTGDDDGNVPELDQAINGSASKQDSCSESTQPQKPEEPQSMVSPPSETQQQQGLADNDIGEPAPKLAKIVESSSKDIKDLPTAKIKADKVATSDKTKKKGRKRAPKDPNKVISSSPKKNQTASSTSTPSGKQPTTTKSRSKRGPSRSTSTTDSDLKKGSNPFLASTAYMEKDLRKEVWKVIMEYQALVETIIEGEEMIPSKRKTASHGLLRKILVRLMENAQDSVLHALRPQLGGRTCGTRDRATSVRREQELHACCKSGNLDRVQQLIQLEKVNHTALTHNMETPLFIAVKHDQYAVAKYLLERGTNPNIKCTKEKIPPLYEAAKRNNPSMIQLLISCGADRYLSCGDHYNLPRNRRGGPTKLLHSRVQPQESSQKIVVQEDALSSLPQPPTSSSLPNSQQPPPKSQPLHSGEDKVKEPQSTIKEAEVKNMPSSSSSIVAPMPTIASSSEIDASKQPTSTIELTSSTVAAKQPSAVSTQTPSSIPSTETLNLQSVQSTPQPPQPTVLAASVKREEDEVTFPQAHEQQSLQEQSVKKEEASQDSSLDPPTVFSCPGITLGTWSMLINAPGRWKQAGMAARKQLNEHTRKKQEKMERDRLRKQKKKTTKVKKDPATAEKPGPKPTKRRAKGAGTRQRATNKAASQKQVGENAQTQGDGSTAVIVSQPPSLMGRMTTMTLSSPFTSPMHKSEMGRNFAGLNAGLSAAQAANLATVNTLANDPRSMASAMEARSQLEKLFVRQPESVKSSKAYASAKSVLQFELGEQCLVGSQVNEALGLGEKNVWNKHRTIFKFTCDKREKQYIAHHYPDFVHSLGERPLTLIRYADMNTLSKIHPNYQTDLSYSQKINSLPRLRLDFKMLEFIWKKQHRLLNKKADHVGKSQDDAFGGNELQRKSGHPTQANDLSLSSHGANGNQGTSTNSSLFSHPSGMISITQSGVRPYVSAMPPSVIQLHLTRLEGEKQQLVDDYKKKGESPPASELMKYHQKQQELVNRQMELQKEQLQKLQQQSNLQQQQEQIAVSAEVLTAAVSSIEGATNQVVNFPTILASNQQRQTQEQEEMREEQEQEQAEKEQDHTTSEEKQSIDKNHTQKQEQPKEVQEQQPQVDNGVPEVAEKELINEQKQDQEAKQDQKQEKSQAPTESILEDDSDANATKRAKVMSSMTVTASEQKKETPEEEGQGQEEGEEQEKSDEQENQEGEDHEAVIEASQLPQDVSENVSL